MNNPHIYSFKQISWKILHFIETFNLFWGAWQPQNYILFPCYSALSSQLWMILWTNSATPLNPLNITQSEEHDDISGELLSDYRSTGIGSGTRCLNAVKRTRENAVIVTMTKYRQNVITHLVPHTSHSSHTSQRSMSPQEQTLYIATSSLITVKLRQG